MILTKNLFVVVIDASPIGVLTNVGVQEAVGVRLAVGVGLASRIAVNNGVGRPPPLLIGGLSAVAVGAVVLNVVGMTVYQPTGVGGASVDSTKDTGMAAGDTAAVASVNRLKAIDRHSE